MSTQGAIMATRDPRSCTEVLPTGGRRVETIVEWQNDKGESHCLARVFIPGTESYPSMVILSELRTNLNKLGITLDFSGAALTLYEMLISSADIDLRNAVWIAQYGSFSSYEYYPTKDNFIKVTLTWDKDRFLDDISLREEISLEEIPPYVTEGLKPVPDVLEKLGWEKAASHQW